MLTSSFLLSYFYPFKYYGLNGLLTLNKMLLYNKGTRNL